VHTPQRESEINEPVVLNGIMTKLSHNILSNLCGLMADSLSWGQ